MKGTKVLSVCAFLFLGVFANLTPFCRVAEAAPFSESVAKNAALQMTATLENSTTELQYNYAENINDGRGITFGAIGFCTGTYDGNILIKHYTTLNPNNNLAKYIPALNAIDDGPHNSADGDGNASTTGLSGFIEAVESNTDPLFRQAQIDMLDELYWDPALEIFNDIGGKNNLTMAYIYDMCVRQGPDGAQDIIDEATDNVGGTPADGVNENTFLAEVFSVRDDVLEDEGLGDVDRNDGFKLVLNSGNVNLNTPYTFTAYGDSFTIKGSTSNPPATTYTVTVNNGLGGGTYSAGEEVTIVANLPVSGKAFDRWTGSTQYLDSITSYTNTFTMPASNIFFTATYQNIAPATYALTVTNGSGDGAYTTGTQVTITANTPAPGKVFDKWTGGTSSIASTTSSTTTVTMPSADITLIANYKEAPKYILTVANGTGDGSYAQGAETVITADTPATGKVFDKWTGATSYISSTISPTTIVTMPASSITLTATYKDAPSYALAITNGTGDGSYKAGTKVTITADTPATGKVFDKWTGATTYVTSTTSATTTVTMPSLNITLTATYKDAAKYTLNIISGNGDGSYALGTKVTITADTPATGKVFDKWTGSTIYISSIYTSTATVTMPASSVTLTATYKDATVSTYNLTITNGTGGGSYHAGTQVTITADTPATGKVFDKWTGSTTYISSMISPTTIVTMPASSITLTATYRDSDLLDPSTSFLMIGYGSGDGAYPVGTQVTITANEPAKGLVFDKWTRDTEYVSDIYSTTPTVTIPDHGIILVASYERSDDETFRLVVSGGTGGDDYLPGTEVTITADTPDTNKVFDQWVGDISHIDDTGKAIAIVTMPEEDITLVA
ncbi:MAG: chitosanase, partial [Candidatus Paceibacterota bacterium]